MVSLRRSVSDCGNPDICKELCVATRQIDFESGGCAAAPYFLLLAQKKVGKENGTLLPRPSGSLRFSSVTGVRQLASLKHGSLEPCH